MQNVKRLTKAFNLCNSSNDFSIDVINDIHYYQALRSILFKLNKGDAPDADSMNEHVSKMMQEAIKSEGIEELLSKEKDINSESVDLFSDEYLERINRIALPNTKVKILTQLLKQKIGEFKKINRIKALSFSEKLQNVIDNYNKRSDDKFVQDVLDDVSNQLLDLLKKLKEEQKSFEKMGIDYEEKAFYDILVSVAKKYKFIYPEDKNILLAKEIHKKIIDKSKYSDWTNRNDIKAEMQAEIIILLAQNGYPPTPPEVYEKIYADIIQQAENFKKYTTD